MTYLGAIILVISALFIGISKAREERLRVKTLRELCSALEIIKNEICTNRTSLGKVISMQSLHSSDALNSFFSELENGFSNLGDRRFSNIWNECIKNSLGILSEKAKNELIALGSNLGRYDADLQKQAIERCAYALQRECEALESVLVNNEKMYIGLSGGAGLILVLMLV